MNAVDRRHYVVDNPNAAVIELESILDIISFADKESLRRMMNHEAFKHDDTFQQHRNQIMNSIYNYTEHLLNQCKH